MSEKIIFGLVFNMKYQEALDYFQEISKAGIVPGLESITNLCKKLDEPQKTLKFIQIAGTNGKGSALAYISTILKAAGYRVGRYSSPAVFELREIIQVNGKNITQRELCEGVELIRAKCRELVSDGKPQPTVFEVQTALAFWYFKKKQCDIVVLETGMGGLNDATNIVENTVLSVITSVGMDHMQFLGHTLTEIAIQKAGIIKPGSSVVCMNQLAEVVNVMSTTAAEKKAAFYLSDVKKATAVKYGVNRQYFNYKGYHKLEISLAGKFQIANAVLAVDAAEVLGKQGFHISEASLRRGLKETQWQGRFSVIDKNPLFLVDGAHNEDAAQKLSESIEFYFTNKRIIYIMGMLRDKEIEKVIGLTVPFAEHIITVTPPDNNRAMSSLELAENVCKKHSCVTAADSIEDAVEMSSLLAGKDGIIIAFGSLSYLGKLIEIVRKKSGSRENKGSGKTTAGRNR